MKQLKFKNSSVFVEPEADTWEKLVRVYRAIGFEVEHFQFLFSEDEPEGNWKKLEGPLNEVPSFIEIFASEAVVHVCWVD